MKILLGINLQLTVEADHEANEDNLDDNDLNFLGQHWDDNALDI